MVKEPVTSTYACELSTLLRPEFWFRVKMIEGAKFASIRDHSSYFLSCRLHCFHQIRPLQLALEYAFKAREMRVDFKEAVENSQALERRLDRLEEDLRTARLVETSLLEQNEETKRFVEFLIC
jgi:hypothetical protein